MLYKLLADIYKLLSDIINFIINLLTQIKKGELHNAWGSIAKLLSDISNKLIVYIDNIFNGPNYRYYISLILILIIVSVYFIIYYFNPFNIEKTKYSTLTIVTVIGVLVSLFYFFVYRKDANHKFYENNKSLIDENKKFNSKNFKDSISNPILRLLKGFFGVIMLVLIPVIIISVLFTAYNNFNNMYYVTKLFLGILITITTLAIVAYIFKIMPDKECNKLNPNNDDNTNKNFIWFMKNVGCIIKNLIFFLPCLLIILADEINDDIKLTPSSVYILFIFELILICLLFILPVLFKYISGLNKNNLLGGQGPYYLNEHKELGNYQQFSSQYNKTIAPLTGTKITAPIPLFDQYNLEAKFNGKDSKKFPYNYSYSISFYLYLNPQPKNTSLAYNKESNLFNYGNKPVIVYDGNNRELIIKSKTQKNEGPQLDTIFSTKDIKYQKWLYFVINYENNVIDVFIDGKLVSSKNNVPPYFDNDKVTIGEENGIHGSIKEIYYFEKPRPQNTVEFLYDLTKN